MNESRSDKFKRLATQRTNAVLDKLRLLGNLSNKSNYDYSPEVIEKIFKTLQEQFNHAKTKFLIKENKRFQL